MKNYTIGEIVEGIVTGISDYGIFLSFDNDVSGLIHISEISNSFVRNINDYTKIGDKMKAEIIGVDLLGNKLKLSIKKLVYNNKKKYSKILETTKGFATLNKKLNGWILEKLDELSNSRKINKY